MRALHTPQQETSSAYNPGVTFRGGEFLAQGIGQAAGALTEGFQRYQVNKAENDALNTRFEGTAKPLMERLKTLGQLADETSPAAGLLDKAADWHKLGTSQKKVLLADMLLLGDKAEAEQRRNEDEQWKRLAVQNQQAQFEEQQRQHQIVNARNAGQDVWRMGTDLYDRARNARLDMGRAATEGVNLQLLQANLAAMQAKAQQGGQDRAAYQSMMQMAQPVEVGPMPTMQFNAARAMQQTGGVVEPEAIAALEKMGRPGFQPQILPMPGGGSAFLTSANSAVPWSRPAQASAEAKLAPQAVSAVLKAETRYSDALVKYRNNPKDAKLQAELDASLANLNHLKRVTGTKAAPGAAAPAPAAPAASGQPIRYKLVNGQLVQE